MKRVILGIACVSASVLIAVGCSSSDSAGTPVVGVDSAVTADTAPPAPRPDAQPPAKPDAKPAVDSGPSSPACYSLPAVNTQGDKATPEQVVQALSNVSAYGYHPPMAASGGCSPADVSAFVVAVDAKNAANTSKSYAGTFLTQLDAAGVEGVSESCKSCIVAEYTIANGPTARWGVSGGRSTEARAPSTPTNLFSVNTIGCTQLLGATTEAQARALHRGNSCSAVLCQACTSQLDLRECSEYALSDGACSSFKADFDAAAPTANPLVSAGGACADLSKVVTAFCGRLVGADAGGGGGASDAGVGQ